ncbi:MAG TPA: CYTH and CHAD domain-containing protein [Burkholderiaceae bacterium]|nr:CYTH and CHAD domain-containing protein [Burkholderiaceae bacterium]
MKLPRAAAATTARPDVPPPAEAARAPLAAMEIELKLAVPEAALGAIRRKLNTYGRQPPLQVASVYFDTADRRLALQRAALRVRRIGQGPDAQWIQTLKTNDRSGALSQRGEWEAPVAGPRPMLTGLTEWPLQQLLGPEPVRLIPIFRTQFERTARSVQYQGTRIEIALDEGRVAAGRRIEPLCEVELELREPELRHGSLSAVFDLALDLIGRGSKALALRPECESKATRGYRLAVRGGQRPAHADAEGFCALLRPDRTHQDAARRIVGHGVHLVLANAKGAALGEDLEYVHQARVALRRTRSALRVLGVARTADDPIARDLRWLADCFGAVRDWDVLLTQSLPLLRKATADGQRAQWDQLMQKAQQRRQRQQLRLRATLASAAFAQAAVRLLRWAEVPPAAAASNLTQQGRRAIERGHQRLAAAARDLAKLPPQGRHRLRILTKRQRYALELLAALLDDGAPARTLKQLSRLQQLLGEINDVHVAVSMLPSLTRSRELARRAQRWSDKVVQRNLGKAQARFERLIRRGSGV